MISNIEEFLLGDLIEVASGQVDPRQSPFSEMPHIGGDNIESHTGQLSGIKSAAALGLTSGKYLFSESDILYSKIRPNLNKVATPDFDGICSADIYPLRPNADKIEKRYLLYVLRSKEFLAFAEQHSTRTNIPKINRTALLSYSVPLPPLSEQKRIADILDKADAVRRKRQETNNLLDEYPHSLFRDMFGHPDQNPMNWPTHQFDDVAESRLGKMLDAKQQTGKHLRPYMRNLNVQWGKLDLSEVFEMDFAETHREEFRLQFGDVLICEGGAGVGQTAIWRDELPECYFQKSLHRVRPYPDKATPEFIAFLMWTLMKGSSLLGFISSATIPHLTGVKLKQIRIPVPPMKLQQEFQRQIHTYNSAREHGRVAHTETDALFNTLVQRAFKGEL